MASDALTGSSRQVALAFLGAYWLAKLPQALALCRSDAVIELPQSLAIVTPALIKDVLPGIFAAIYQRFVGERFEVVVERTLAEGDAVLVEYRASGDLKSGRRFDCRYAAVLRVEAERVALFRQYTDTKYVAAELMS